MPGPVRMNAGAPKVAQGDFGGRDARAPRLDNLNFSIEDFQRVSSGKYNAGNLVLGAAGRLDIANNHVHFTSKNNVKVDGNESLAIRVAFLRALENAGVRSYDLGNVRKRLGLFGDEALKDGVAFQPLTRQEVREIIDSNSTKINEGRAPEARLKSDFDLHEKFGNEKNEKLKATREAVNAAIQPDAVDKTVAADIRLPHLVLADQGAIRDLPREDLEGLSELLERMKDALKELREAGAGAAKISDTVSLALAEGKVSLVVEKDGAKVTLPLPLDAARAAERFESAGLLAKKALGDALAAEEELFLREASGDILQRDKIYTPEEIRNWNVRAMPQITSQWELRNFFMGLSLKMQHGGVAEDGTAPDALGTERKVFTFQGIVFRADDRYPSDETMKDGFTSRNDLSDPENKTEAMGLGKKSADGKRCDGLGATGQSGVSTAKTLDGAIGYLNPMGKLYIIDTTKLPKDEKAWDMESNVLKNDYGRDEDQSKGEVNVSRIPKCAIIGYLVAGGSPYVFDQPNNNGKRFETLQDLVANNLNIVHFNEDYRP